MSGARAKTPKATKSPVKKKPARRFEERIDEIDNDPLWYKDAIIYEIHVKSFQDSNGDGMGDFEGLRQRLPYVKDLGVTAIWILPFYPSPLRDDGYDIADYTGVNPDYGTIKDFKNFLKDAHKLGLKVITELVINHTSDQHPWFQRARKANPGSPERNFYVWSDTPDLYKDVRIIFIDTERSNWTYDPEAKAYYWHRFFSHQPDLNFANPAVFREVVRVMRFWLDMGVDGLRLDAIPYLCERDGTNCENLPETHAVLKRLRAALDERYEGRMFLAEANQWPADVRPYFGDGDECHVAFHFPLMPRLFMGLRREDRHPISEIMAQTPDPPPTCQWALFLRNHDELTLEMVTDEERDYMYREYARDSRMRLNLGIRRRLAPLVDFSRRRMELLHSLLFSLPGTPVLYYGDELGMSDNIYLGDRNGVRTPMQWTADRNAGFSTADSARLYSPILTDPLGGYQIACVEAHSRGQSSFLNWMKRLIAVRRERPVFGRGSLEMLAPHNRRVLAFVREYRGERILVVANLSRFVQPVELDLTPYQGLVPVELLGKVAFPRIGESPYFLSLGPHEFMWFSLRGVPAERIEIEAEHPPAVAEAPQLEYSGPRREFASGGGLAELASSVMPSYLKRRRWFGGKGRKIKEVRFLDQGMLESESDGGNVYFLALAQVTYSDRHVEKYFIPLALAEADSDIADDVIERSLVARAKGSEGDVAILDALLIPEFGQELLDLVANRTPVGSANGIFTASAADAFETLRGPVATGPLKVDPGKVEQSNSSLRYGDRLFMKVYRKIESGVHPEVEIARVLAAAGFRNSPLLGGEIEYQDHDGRTSSIAMLQGLVQNQGDGWARALDHLGRYFERALVADAAGRTPQEVAADPAALQDIAGAFIDSMDVLGRRTGEMHRALATGSTHPDFAPEPMRSSDVAGLAETIAERAAAVVAAIEQSMASLPEDLRASAEKLVARRGEMPEWMRSLKKSGVKAQKTRIHGDYHLGQVLCAEADFVIIDFEGEPALPIAERRLKDSPLRDVAGMTRSFSYAAMVGLDRATAERHEDRARLLPWANFWLERVAHSFLGGYFAATKSAAFVPSSRADFDALRRVYELNKALYEVLYEINNRPKWLWIPLRGLEALLA